MIEVTMNHLNSFDVYPAIFGVFISSPPLCPSPGIISPRGFVHPCHCHFASDPPSCRTLGDPSVVHHQDKVLKKSQHQQQHHRHHHRYHHCDHHHHHHRHHHHHHHHQVIPE